MHSLLEILFSNLSKFCTNVKFYDASYFSGIYIIVFRFLFFEKIKDLV